MDDNKFKLFEFKLEKMVKDPAIVMIGKRGTGKSYITRDIMYHLRHIPGGVIIAGTDKVNPFFKLFFPDLYIHYDIKDNIFKKILLRQFIMTAKAKNKLKEGKKVDPSSILIMDDCLAQNKTWAKNENIREVLMNGRHYRLTYILTMQYLIGIGPELRGQFDYIFLLKESSAMVKKKLWDNYAGMFHSLPIFEKVFSFCTQNNCAMVIDNRNPSDNIQEKVFWFKAKDRKFTFGSKSFKDFHKKYYDPKYLVKKNLELMNIGNLFNRRKGDIDIRIEKI